MLTDTVAEISLIADHSRLASGLRSAMGMIASFASGAGGLLKKNLAPQSPGKGQGWASHAMGQVAGNLAMRGIDLMVDQGKQVLDFERKLTRFGIAARQTPEQLNDIRKAARETSVATGIDATVVLDSARAYVDLAGAQNSSIEKMKILARTGQASEAEGKDLAGMMYQLTRSMKVADDQMEDTMGGLINQAKDGAIEAKQMAAEFSGMMPIFARFGIVGREGAIQLGAMYQVTRDGFDSAAQAATGMIRLMAGFQRHASRFEKFGVHVFKPGSKKDLRELSDIMEQVKKSPLSKDIEALIKSFGRSEAWRTFELIAEAPKRLKELEESGRANGVVQADLARQIESTGGRVDIAIAKMKNAFAEALTPDRLEQIVEGIGAIANAMGPLMHAIGGVASAFGSFVHMVARAKQSIAGKSHLELTGRDESLYNALQLEEGGHKTYMTDKEREEAKRIRDRKKNYDHAIGDIMGDEDDWGVTDASIKKAIRYARSWAGTGPKMEGDEAAIAYLKERDKEISPARYKRLDSEVAAEEDKNLSPYALTQKRYAQAEAADRAKAAAQAAYMKEHIKPVIDAVGKHLGEAISRAIHAKPTEVKIDGNPVAKAGSNATDKRRK